MKTYKDWICRYYSEHEDGEPDGEIIQELIRCKDCGHWYSDADTGMACEFTNLGQPEDGFCNWAERKIK